MRDLDAGGGDITMMHIAGLAKFARRNISASLMWLRVESDLRPCFSAKWQRHACARAPSKMGMHGSWPSTS
eukprot:3273102-Pleurochrysis_carterae.AAC.3